MNCSLIHSSGEGSVEVKWRSRARKGKLGGKEWKNLLEAPQASTRSSSSSSPAFAKEEKAAAASTSPPTAEEEAPSTLHPRLTLPIFHRVPPISCPAHELDPGGYMTVATRPWFGRNLHLNQLCLWEGEQARVGKRVCDFGHGDSRGRASRGTLGPVTLVLYLFWCCCVRWWGCSFAVDRFVVEWTCACDFECLGWNRDWELMRCDVQLSLCRLFAELS